MTSTSTSALVAELEAQGLRPLVRDGKLKLAGPKARVTPDLVERVRAHRAQLIALFGAGTHEADITEVQHPDDQPPAGPQPRVEKAAAPRVALRDDPKIDDEVRYEIRNWEQQLRLMGWSEERIWRRQFWPHSREHPRGLPAVMEPGDRIRLADHEHLLIEKHDGSLLRFRKVEGPPPRMMKDDDIL